MYLLNTSTRTVHNADSEDGRCKISQIREENKKQFNTKDAALAYLPIGNRPTKLCTFCFNNKTISTK